MPRPVNSAKPSKGWFIRPAKRTANWSGAGGGPAEKALVALATLANLQVALALAPRREFSPAAVGPRTKRPRHLLTPARGPAHPQPGRTQLASGGRYAVCDPRDPLRQRIGEPQGVTQSGGNRPPPRQSTPPVPARPLQKTPPKSRPRSTGMLPTRRPVPGKRRRATGPTRGRAKLLQSPGPPTGPPVGADLVTAARSAEPARRTPRLRAEAVMMMSAVGHAKAANWESGVGA